MREGISAPSSLRSTTLRSPGRLRATASCLPPRATARPPGAITPAGDHVAVNAEICAGCGQCAAACPTGAASYALPPADTQLQIIRAMLLAYREAGGTHPVLLLHDGQHGTPLIDALARHGDGLP